MLDFPIAPPIRVKDSPQERRLDTLNDARSFVDDALALASERAVARASQEAR